MFSTIKSSIFYYLLILIPTLILVSSDDVPVMIWNVKGNALDIRPVPALGHNEKLMMESLKDIHRKSSKILVFAIDKLSLEDFSANEKPYIFNNTLFNLQTFLESQPHMYFPSVKDPLYHIHNKAHCGIQEIVVDNTVDESVMQSISSAMQRSCVVILHISGDGIASKESELKSVFLPSFENSDENIVAIFTGNRSSWGTQNNERHVLRNLLATAPSEDNFVNITGCIIMYAENATIKFGKNSTELPLPASTEGSSCGNVSVLQLDFTTTGLLTSVTVKFTFEQKKSAWNTSATVTAKGEEINVEDVVLNSDFVEAPLGFSFSCGDLVLQARNRSYDITLTIKRFQVQPYTMQEAFSESFDCVPYFTLPIWMGVFVSLIFIVITNIGVYALFSVRTMDRFDDPKGKAISVGNTAE